MSITIKWYSHYLLLHPMDYISNKSLQQFRNEVGIKFQLYNSLFTSLPFNRVEKTGILLSLFSNNCEEGFQQGQSPADIIEDFFTRHTNYHAKEERNDLLFRFVQYAERQVVLFDALEDAAFKRVHDITGPGTLKQLESEIIQKDKEKELEKKLNDFSVRLVLTAHPTQFYPGPVLGIINDLAKALAENNTSLINSYLQQLGKTPFFKKTKPTPYDEAISLIWYLENVFYFAAGRIVSSLHNQFPDAINKDNPVIRMGFWPGGDKDGNPFVTSEITLKVADALRGSIIKCYYLDVRKLRRRLTFEGVDVLLRDLEANLYNNLFIPGFKTELKKEDILNPLEQIKEILVNQHNGLFLHLLDNLIYKVELFGLHFVSLDIRQESSVHAPVLQNPENDNTDTLATIKAIKTIRQFNGPEGCHRYIISQCKTAENVLEVLNLFFNAGWEKKEMMIDIVPLFETIDDLSRAGAIMESLYTNKEYREHLERRKQKQTIMLGFSDGTKDGGYLMANWSIYKAKEELTAISRQNGIDVVFFDGRGGPPSRGGGKTHKFYASMGSNISNKEIQVTIQGQTVSSNFGTIDSAQYNIEQLLHAGITNSVFPDKKDTLSPDEEALLVELSKRSLEIYIGLRDHPDLTEYLLRASPLRFYSETNIGSRPAKRGAGSAISLKDLRAIPFAGSWSQLKQNVTGYYGVGSALKQMEEKGKLLQLQKLYHVSLFFRTLLDNCEMAMLKSFFPLTSFLKDDPHFSSIWNMIHDEYELTKEYLQKITGEQSLMAAYPVDRASIQMREKIVLPLLTIQQYALTRLRDIDEDADANGLKMTFEKLAMRCSFGIINAGRNSA